MNTHTAQFQSDDVIWKKDFWISNHETIPKDAKQQIVMDKRQEGVADLVKQNKRKSTLKFDVWQQRPQQIKTMKSKFEYYNTIHHLHQYIVAITCSPKVIDKQSKVVHAQLDNGCDWFQDGFKEQEAIEINDWKP